MRFNARLFVLLTVFYALAAVGYGVTSYFLPGIDSTGNVIAPENRHVEIIGTAAISMLVFMSAFIAFYLNKTHKTQGPVPEDRLDATIEEGDAEIGFFNAFSWWPFWLGLFAAVAFASLAVGWWLFCIGLPFALIAVFGFVFENYRRDYAH